MNAFGAFNVAGYVIVIIILFYLIPLLSCLYRPTALFSRRKVPTKTRKQPLFRFDNSRHALSVSSYIKEQRDKELASQVKVTMTTLILIK